MAKYRRTSGRQASRRTRAGTTFGLDWKGDEVKAQVEAAVVRALIRNADAQEAEQKALLVPGRGVLTGRLQRSIHAAGRSYRWEQDWEASYERGDTPFEPDRLKNRYIVASGSGLQYAHLVEDRYQFIQRGHEKVAPRLESMLREEAQKEGL